MAGRPDASIRPTARSVVLRSTGEPRSYGLIAISAGVGVIAGLVAFALYHLIGLITNAAFSGRLSAAFTSPAQNHSECGSCCSRSWAGSWPAS